MRTISLGMITALMSLLAASCKMPEAEPPKSTSIAPELALVRVDDPDRKVTCYVRKQQPAGLPDALSCVRSERSGWPLARPREAETKVEPEEPERGK